MPGTTLHGVTYLIVTSGAGLIMVYAGMTKRRLRWRTGPPQRPQRRNYSRRSK